MFQPGSFFKGKVWLGVCSIGYVHCEDLHDLSRLFSTHYGNDERKIGQNQIICL